MGKGSNRVSVHRLEIEKEWDAEKAEAARAFCKAFTAADDIPRYILGRNVYSRRLAELVDVSGFIDDFARELEYLGKPVLKSEDVPKNALVVVASGGRPLTVRGRMQELGLSQLDYFSFIRFSDLPLTDVVFNEGFVQAYEENTDKVQWVYGLLEDDESRCVMAKLFNFRYTLDLDHLAGFVDRQRQQYFEPFLDMKPGTVFWDVGGYDGATALEFVKYCPDFGAIHVFEPDPSNIPVCTDALKALPRSHVWQCGAGARNETVRFSSDGSGSVIVDDGAFEIDVRRLDDLSLDAPNLIKMDIEGAELAALDGARSTIADAKPQLAIAVYHRPSDFWRVPEIVLSAFPDYRVYLRHYTEAIYETVMFFVPR